MLDSSRLGFAPPPAVVTLVDCLAFRSVGLTACHAEKSAIEANGITKIILTRVTEAVPAVLQPSRLSYRNGAERGRPPLGEMLVIKWLRSRNTHCPGYRRSFSLHLRATEISLGPETGHQHRA